MSEIPTLNDDSTYSRRQAWRWIPSLYFAQGVPYVVVMTVAVIMYKRLGVSNTEIALYTSWLYLPWVIKPFWSPLVDVLRTKRWWIVSMQLLIGAGLAGVALTLPTSNFLQYSLAFLWLLAFSSATHDIAADGFYMLAMPAHEQAWFVGIRSTFYRLAMIAGQGLLVMLAGALERLQGIPQAWATTFYLLGGFFLICSAYHGFVLPVPSSDTPGTDRTASEVISDFIETFISFFNKPGIGLSLAFLLLYRFSEAQLAKMASPFLLDPIAKGGLGFTTEQVGVVYGTVGIAMLTLGGILGGIVAARQGLKFWLWWMVAAINLPNAVYVFLSQVQPENYIVVNLCVAIEQFGYGFGFTAFMLYMLYISRGEHETAHYAICTGFMALGMMLPGMLSGWLQELIGYQRFFIWMMIATVPSFIVCGLVKIDPSFGRRNTQEITEESVT
ncbi:AmpG family muropeptide MFS transporter [Bythopirellula polymerisocia]|uniref:Muropeptide transporter n=1 Tax=Bythopirellula polymerisocia TaxID=2528003 RepID=A0A5C6CN87_9BACT|nr:AmpG family muropeptide MFS transporter [Bythopirellula polymerisocia]TWU24516.1 muropeptide transporter [Bythopirellula polymerisocia]